MAEYPKNQRGETKGLIRQRYLRVYTPATEAEKNGRKGRNQFPAPQ